jgi:hypothetical protein
VTRNAKRDGKNPEGVLLDRSLHHRAMLDLPEGEKRGRPDILHFCLLEALGSPLNKAGKLKAMAQNLNGDFIDFAPELRLPRDCNRFDSLMEQLFAEKRVPRWRGNPDDAGEEEPGTSRETHQTGRSLTSHGKAEKLADLCMGWRERTPSSSSAPIHGAGEEPHRGRQVSIHPEALRRVVVRSSRYESQG